jgi:hypothetical protein
MEEIVGRSRTPYIHERGVCRHQFLSLMPGKENPSAGRHLDDLIGRKTPEVLTREFVDRPGAEPRLKKTDFGPRHSLAACAGDELHAHLTCVQSGREQKK